MSNMITEPMITSMKQASSWIRFLAICGFIYAGSIVAPGFLTALFFPLIDLFADGSLSAELGMSSILFGIILLVAIAIIGTAIIFPVIFLYNFGTKMRTYVQTNNVSALELAFKNNKSFWKFCGIFTIISFALIPISLIIIFIIVGVSYV